MGKVVSRKFDEVKRITYPTEWTANTNTTIDGYIVPEMARHQFEAFMEFFELAKNCLFKCFEGTNMIYLNMVNSYHGNGTEELFFNYPGVGIVKYHRSTMDLDTITTSLIKYNDSPQTISITGTSGSLSDDQYLELQTTDAKILLADEDNIMLDKIKDSGTEFTYSAMIVNTSSALVGYSVVVNEDQSWTRYKKTVS